MGIAGGGRAAIPGPEAVCCCSFIWWSLKKQVDLELISLSLSENPCKGKLSGRTLLMPQLYVIPQHRDSLLHFRLEGIRCFQHVQQL